MLPATSEREGDLLLSDEELERKQAKAEEYAAQPERVLPLYLEFEMEAEHGNHLITYDGDKWVCSCNFFQIHQTCSHVMAMGRMLRHLPIVQPRGNVEDT